MTDEQLHRACIDTIPEKLKLNWFVPCRRCGTCCKMLNAAFLDIELANVCRYLNIDQNTFREKYATKDTRDNPDGMKMIAPCPLLDNENNCKIYHIRPLSCALYPFSSTLLTIKPCQKGLEMYKILEKWYNDHDNNAVTINNKSVGNVMKGFYARQYPHIECIDDTDKPLEIEDILKDDSIKAHGITVIPDKESLKKICKYLKKKSKRV